MSGYVVCVTFVVDPASAVPFLDAMMEQASNSLALEDGCSQFDVCVDPDDPARIFLYEIYDDRAAFDLHLASDHFLTFDAATRDWVKDKQVTTWHRNQGLTSS
ncbi:MAG: putative quinol monooxygenase [Pseudomonadota bacterium]